MATDVEILTAAREVAAAVQAVKDADQAKLAADREAAVANDTAQAARKRYQEAEGRLVLLSRQKPAAEPIDYQALKKQFPDLYPTTGMVNVVPVAELPPSSPLPPPSSGPVPTLTRKRERV